MDLSDRPDAMKISTRSVVVKPENQANITQGTNRIIKFHIPENISYFKPSESNFTFNIKMQGRGRPIPDRACGGFHALVHNIRALDGTNSHRLEESLEYNTYCSQLTNYTRGEANDNKKAMYEGFQASQSVKNNLYWALDGQNWTLAPLVKMSIPRSVQICSPLHTKMLSTEQFIPNAVLGGLRLELELDDYRRSLIYTTNKLGVEQENGVVSLPNLILAGAPGTRGKNGAGATEVLSLELTTAGNNFTLGRVYPFAYSDGGDQVGFARCNAVAGVNPTEFEIYAIGGAAGSGSVKQPEPGDDIYIDSGATKSVCKVLPGILGNPAGIICNPNQEIEIPIFCGTDSRNKISGTRSISAYLTDLTSVQAAAGPLVASPPDIFSTAGTDSTRIGTLDSLRNPFSNHFVNGAYPTTAQADVDTDDCFPETNIPFDVGDSLYIANLNPANPREQYVGLVSAIKRYGTPTTTPTTSGPNLYCKICIKPNVQALTLASGDPGIDTAANKAFGDTNEYGFFNGKNGLVLYTKNEHRLNGVPQTNAFVQYITDVAVKNASQLKVDYEISDLQYQVCEVSMDDSVLSSDMAAANSEKGLQIDLETIHTNLTNLVPNTGPNSQLINTGTIERALGIMSVPLVQNNQRSLLEPAFNGEVDTMINYQWRLGINGLVPNQPVAVEKASAPFPITQSQYVNEALKAVESFGISLTNLHKVLMNFSVPRAFSRPGMYYNLIKAGSLSLQTENGSAPLLGSKLFVHFINHLRSINISKNGIVIQN